MTFLLLLSCAREPTICEDGPKLFGVPNENTGLDEAACGPSCGCGGETWEPRAVTAEDLASWRAASLENPPAPVDVDPYDAPAGAPPSEGAVCAVLPTGGGSYRLADYEDARAAERAGAVPTHSGRCGACSTLADLAVYAEQPDLTEPVRACGIAHLSGPPEELRACIETLGFTPACAQIWTWNTLHTRETCGAVCLANLDAPYNLPDGSLNECLACDERESGPVFSAVAGRTRRNTGLPSSMCRPCGEVRPLSHEYPIP